MYSQLLQLGEGLHRPGKHRQAVEVQIPERRPGEGTDRPAVSGLAPPGSSLIIPADHERAALPPHQLLNIPITSEASTLPRDAFGSSFPDGEIRQLKNIFSGKVEH